MNDGQIFFLLPFLLQLCFAPVEYMEQGGGGLGLIHECPARTLRMPGMETRPQVADYLRNLSALAHSCPSDPLCIIAHNSVWEECVR